MSELKPCPHCNQMTDHTMPICMGCGKPILKPIINQVLPECLMREIAIMVGCDMSNVNDFTGSAVFPNMFVGYLGKTSDGKVEMAKREIIKGFSINKKRLL